MYWWDVVLLCAGSEVDGDRSSSGDGRLTQLSDVLMDLFRTVASAHGRSLLTFMDEWMNARLTAAIFEDNPG